MKNTYTMEEAAVYLGVRERTIFNYRARGVLKATPDNNAVLTGESVERLKQALDVVKGRGEEVGR